MSKTNLGLLEYAKAQLGKPYWYGTFGQTGTAELHSSKKVQYPDYYTASDFPSQYGQRVHDCIGLCKGYIWSENATATPKYNANQDTSAAGAYSKSTVKGTIDSLPEIPGILVYKGSTPAKITHVGVYGADGYVYEAKGHAYGVVKTAFKASQWPYWSKYPYIEYVENNTPSITTEEVEEDMTQEKFEEMFEVMMAKKYGDEKDDWAEECTAWAKSLGIATGDGETPNNYNWKMPTRREATISFLYEFAKLKGLA